MSVRIAVSDPLPVFRRGIMAILDGYDVEEPDDLMAWAEGGQPSAILLTLGTPGDWSLLSRLHESAPDAVVIALLSEPTEEAYLSALRNGASGALPRDAPPESVRDVLRAATRGTSLLPVEVVRALAARAESRSHASGPPAAHEIEWLRRLAQGVTVGRLADQVGYSERAMFRQLNELYTKLHVKNRTEALMYGRERGWL